jgi:hypothetical protein
MFLFYRNRSPQNTLITFTIILLTLFYIGLYSIVKHLQTNIFKTTLLLNFASIPRQILF